MKTVINLHMPQTEAVYIHRVGRTARAGHSGRAVTFVEEDRRMLMKEFVKRAVEAHQDACDQQGCKCYWFGVSVVHRQVQQGVGGAEEGH